VSTQPRAALAALAALAAVAVAVACAIWWVTRPSAKERAGGARQASEDVIGASLPPLPATDEPPPSRASEEATEHADKKPDDVGGGAIKDRAKREAMRELLWRAFGRSPPPATQAQPDTAYVLPKEPPPPPEGDGGTIEPKYIQEHVRNEFFDLAKGCYADAIPKLANPRGKVVFWFTIVGDEKIGGIVESVDVLDESTLRDPEMIECMRQSFLSVTFPPPKGGGWVTVGYPIEFSPGEDE
jgi:hypothetical protein